MANENKKGVKSSKKKAASRKRGTKVTGNSHKSSTAPPRGTPEAAEHLRPYMFKPGQSGNPSGRPKDVAGILARAVFEGLSDKELLAIIKGYRKKMTGGDSKAFAALAERGYGKMSQGMELSAPGGQPFAPPVFNIVGCTPKPKE